MVNKYAIVKDGVVENIIKATAEVAAGRFSEDPTRELIQSDVAGVGDTYDGKVFTKIPAIYDYAALRRAEYPSLEDQFDMIFHDLEANDPTVTTWRDAIRAVKAKYPKP